jgi:uncharacterized protein DUF3592
MTIAGVVGFVLAFFHLVTHDTPSACYGSDCLHGEGRWVLAFPGSILTFVGGVIITALSGRGYGKTSGPGSFAEVDSGKFAPRDRTEPDAGGLHAPRWTRTWRNTYVYTGLGELGLGLMFIVAGIIQPDFRGGGFFTGGILAAIGIVFLVIGRKAAAKDRLHSTGVEAQAEIRRIEQTGMWMNNNPYVRLDLVLHVPGHQPYEVKHNEIVPAVLVGRLTSGQTLPVKVDKDHPSHFIVEWEKA